MVRLPRFLAGHLSSLYHLNSSSYDVIEKPPDQLLNSTMIIQLVDVKTPRSGSAELTDDAQYCTYAIEEVVAALKLHPIEQNTRNGVESPRFADELLHNTAAHWKVEKMNHRIFAVFVTICLLHPGIDARKGKHGKKGADWDLLEPMVEKIHKEEKNVQYEGSEPHKEDAEVAGLNPCANHFCGWGKECKLNEKGKPTCHCATECPQGPTPDPLDRVCSNTNVTYSSICHLYRERCRCRRDMPSCTNPKHKHLHLQYLGECKVLEECTDEHLNQFSVRMADWLFQVMRDLKKRQELYGDQWVQMIEEAERDDHLKHVYPVIWKYCDLDSKPHDKHVSHHELIPLTAPVIPLESCIDPFLRSCDTNNDEKITLKEWGKCLGLEDSEVFERC
uniref:Follistatin-like domain-containing protein n=1 Tax=Trichuris muris TaxID=70415 RepID=A0A5S6R300_TRIMR